MHAIRRDDDDRAEENVESRPVIADEFLHQRHDLERQLLIVLRKLHAQLLRHPHEISVGLLLRDARLQSAVDCQVVLVVRGLPL